MESLQNEEQRRVLMGFFKTGPGEYGEGDEFLGLKVPQTREVVRDVWKDFPLDEVPELLMSKWHEVRLCGLLILVAKFERLATKRLENDEKAIRGRDEILTMYLKYAERANNWDLVDLSVHKILGHWLLLPTNMGDPLSSTCLGGDPGLHKDFKLKVLDELSQSYMGGLFISTGCEEYRMSRIREICASAAKAMATQLAAESVVSASFEEPFGRHAELEPLRISAGDGEVYVEGKIDRADIINVNGENRVRIIDYKT